MLAAIVASHTPFLMPPTAHLSIPKKETGMPEPDRLPRRHRRYDPLAVLAYIATYQQTHNQRSPSERRIQTDLKVSAPSVVHNLLRRLEEDGLLTITTYGRGHTSDLLLTETGHAMVQRWHRERRAADSGAAPEQP